MHSNKSDKNQYPFISRFKYLLVVLLTLVGIVSSTVAFSKIAHADLISLLSHIMGNQEVSAQLRAPRTADSQISPTIVLQAATNLVEIAQAADVPPPIESDTILSPDIARMNATSTDNLNTQISIYVIRPGDTVSGVAKMFNVSVNTILWANNITGKTALQPGQTFVILPVTGITHTVKSKETIQSIAKTYKADVDEILNYNDLSLNSSLKVGDQIIIPDAENPSLPSTPSRTSIGASYPGFYACPLPGSRLSQKLHGHNGVDLASPVGTPIHASAGGTVIISRANGAWNGGYGNFVVIMHSNGTQTLYSHMSRSAVDVGESVSKSQIIGYVGMTGLTTGPHLHFEVRGAQNPFVNSSLCR